MVSLLDSEKGGRHPHPARSVAERTFGALSPQKRPEDFRALREAFKEEIVEKDARCFSKLWRQVGNFEAFTER